MGFLDIFKKSRKQVNEENQSQGRQGEERIKRDYEFNGYEVERTGKGHDFKARKRDWLTRKKGKATYVEVKTGNSKLSKLQKKKKRQHGSNYVVERLERTPLGLVRASNSDKPKIKKKSSGIDSFFGSGGSSSKRRKSSSGLDSMFGSGSSSRRKSSSGIDSMFGSGGSSSKRRKSGGIW